MALTASAFAGTAFDYLIAGGGTAGLVLAARLSEDPAITVGVIEAGVDRSDDPKVLTPGLATSMWEDPEYDWIFKTVPQADNGRVVAHPRGKLLGGSSGINLNLWTHASQRDIDDWGLLLGSDNDANWSYADLLPYYKKSETYIAPPADIVEAEHIDFIDPLCHGETGPVQNKFPPFYSSFYDAWAPTFANLNLSVQGDPRCGKGGLGGGAALVTFDKMNARSYAGNSYYDAAVRARPNLKILTNTLVTKINFYRRRDRATGNLRAEGLSFRPNGSRRTWTVKAKREVLVTAGTFQSPQLLELSGIGSPDVLERHGIPLLYANAAVGENLQDHVLVPMGFRAAEGEATQEAFRNLTLVQQALELYARERTGPFASSTPAAYLSYEQLLSTIPSNISVPPLPPLPPMPHIVYPSGEDNVMDNDFCERQHALSLAKLHSPSEAAAQILFIPGGTTPAAVSDTSAFLSTPLDGNYFTLFGVLEHPFSRGSVHIASADPQAKAAVDPRYLSDAGGLDAAVLGAVALAMRAVAGTEPLAGHLAGKGTVPQGGFPEELDGGNVEGFVRGAYSSEYHPLGTCAMGVRSGGDGQGGDGVVDSRFRVFGTTNVRVVDASAAPLMVRGNLASLVYAMAERGAEFVREDYGKATARRGIK